MASLEKKAGFLNGLLEGMQLDKDSPKGKLYTGIVELLAELCDRTEAMDEMLNELNEYVEDIDDDLARLEGGDEGEDDEEDFNFFDEDDDYEELPFEQEKPLHLLSSEPKAAESAPKAEEAEDDALDGGICPECGGLSFIEGGGALDRLYICPHCKKKVRLLPLSQENTPIAAPADED